MIISTDRSATDRSASDRPAGTASARRGDDSFRGPRRIAPTSWASSPAMQQKVRELIRGDRPTPLPAPVVVAGRFASNSRVVVVGRRTGASATLAASE